MNLKKKMKKKSPSHRPNSDSQDMVNRRISMDMMLKVAASQRYRQFIFLTPQSMRYSRHMAPLFQSYELLDHQRAICFFKNCVFTVIKL